MHCRFAPPVNKNARRNADEVQTGWGRLGSHFWGFEAQCAQPDIVFNFQK